MNMADKQVQNNRSIQAQKVLCIFFVVLLMMPALFNLIIVDKGYTQANNKTAAPGFNIKLILNSDYYRAWTHYVDSNLASVRFLTQTKRWLDYHLFATSDAKEIHVGRDGWLFDRSSIQDFRKNGCHRKQDLHRLIMDLRTVARLAEASGRRFIFTVVPNKSTIYPEYVGKVPQDPECNQSIYQLLLAEHGVQPIKGFVRVDHLLDRAKKEKKKLYDPTGTYWNQNGAALAAEALLEIITANGNPANGKERDLAKAIVESHKPIKGQPNPSIALNNAKHPSAAVIYGPGGVRGLLPSIVPYFDRLDVIADTSLPSLNHQETIADYETIIVVIPESRLLDLKLKIDPLCRMLEADTSSTQAKPIQLETIKANNGVALKLEKDHLAVKSMGSVAYFSTPKIPGSSSDTLRIIRLDLVAPHNDTLTWSVVDAPMYGGQRKMRSGKTRLYLPLPKQTWVQMRINTGRLAGIFELQKIALLTYGEDKAMADIKENKPTVAPSVSAVNAKRPPVLKKKSKTNEPDSIILNDFQYKRIFQRRGMKSDIFLSGSYRGRPTTIEAKVVHYDTNKAVVPWTVVDSAPTRGIFMGVVPNVPQGGWYRLVVRFQNQPKIKYKGNSPWGVGLLIACIGQSNMKEWFFTGNNHQPHKLLSIHRDGQWISSMELGNGAATFGNRLIDELGIPVGLLDYAVNGSGLRREANWGKGYWADRSDDGIYHKFIRGVTTTGGAAEYVVWMQGEADAARKTITQTQYGNTLKAFITQQVRKDIVNGSHKSQLPFLIVGMVKRPVGQDEPHQGIRNALIATTQNVSDCYLAATTMDLKNMGKQHLSPEAYTEMGLRVSQTILYLLGKSHYYRGPTIDDIVRVNENTLDVNIQHQGGNDIAPLFGITGFKITNGDVIVPIIQAKRQDPGTIRIYLNDGVSGPITIKYLYGAMPDSSGAVRDNSPLRLPLEPFVEKME